MNFTQIKQETLTLATAFTNSEFLFSKQDNDNALYLPSKEFTSVVERSCPYLVSTQGKYKIISIVIALLWAHRIEVSACRFSLNRKQVQGYKVILPKPTEN